MKEIKFRQRLDNDWHYWGFIDGVWVNPASSSSGANPLNSDHYQYTGFKDREGVEIYEGDIVKYRGYRPNMVAVVRYEYGCFLKDYHGGSSTSKSPMLITSKDEVIGNIWEHPTLLEGK